LKYVGILFEVYVYVRCYIVLLYLILYYYILYYTLLFLFLYSLLFLLILSSQSSSTFPIPYNTHLLFHLFLFPLFNPPFRSLFPSQPSQYSFYTCRYLHILIYIISLKNNLTPHKLSEGCLEWCSFMSMCLRFMFYVLTPHKLSEGCLEWCSFICVVFGSGGRILG
jgi:hypothetical protein